MGGRISDMTYSELLQYDFGSWKDKKYAGEKIAKLDDVLDLCKHAGVILELDLAGRMSGDSLGIIHDIGKKYKMQSLTVFTAQKTQFDKFLSKKCDVCISISGIHNLTEAQESLYLRDSVMYANYSLQHWYVTKEICGYAHTNGMKVKTWTIESEERLDRFFELGGDCAIVEEVTADYNIPKILEH